MPEIINQNLTEKEPEKEEIKTSIPAPVPEREREKIRFSNLEDDLNFIPVVSAVPTDPPPHPLRKLVLYVSGGIFRLYVWDSTNNAWRLVSP